MVKAECCPNHIPMLVEIPPHLSISGFIGCLKTKVVLIGMQI